jgi:hypothetical protein
LVVVVVVMVVVVVVVGGGRQGKRKWQTNTTYLGVAVQNADPGAKLSLAIDDVCCDECVSLHVTRLVLEARKAATC